MSFPQRMTWNSRNRLTEAAAMSLPSVPRSEKHRPAPRTSLTVSSSKVCGTEYQGNWVLKPPEDRFSECGRIINLFHSWFGITKTSLANAVKPRWTNEDKLDVGQACFQDRIRAMAMQGSSFAMKGRKGRMRQLSRRHTSYRKYEAWLRLNWLHCNICHHLFLTAAIRPKAFHPWHWH